MFLASYFRENAVLENRYVDIVKFKSVLVRSNGHRNEWFN